MPKKTLKTVPKISVRIWRPLIKALDDKIGSACLRRDAYLAKVLECELDWLDQEIPQPNSQDSYDYVFESLDSLDRKLVSLALPVELTDRLNKICKRKRIVRDAFFNRIYFLLVVPSKWIDVNLFFDADGKGRTEVWSEHKNDGPFYNNGFYPLKPDIDPFWAIRCGLGIYAEQDPAIGNVYTTILREYKDKDLTGLNCYWPDSLIPGSNAEKAELAQIRDMLFKDDPS